MLYKFLKSSKKLFANFLSIGVLLAVLIIPGTASKSYYAENNILKNADFSVITNYVPQNWYIETDKNNPSDFKIQVITVEGDSKNYLSIQNFIPNDSKLIQDISLDIDKTYKISSLVKVISVESLPGSANITLENDSCICTPKLIFNTYDKWQLLEFYIKPSGKTGMNFKFELRLGGTDTLNKGITYFREPCISLIENPDESISVSEFYFKSGSKKNYFINHVSDSPKSKTWALFLGTGIGITIVCILIFSIWKIKEENIS